MSVRLQFCLVGRTGVRRMMVHHENEVHIRRNVIEFCRQPGSLRTHDLVHRAVKHKDQGIRNADRIVSVFFRSENLWK